MAKETIQERKYLQRVVKNHDPEAFAALYDEYVEQIYRFIYFKISDREDAEDLTSQVFLKAWKYLTEGEDKKVESISGLLYTTARRLVIDTYRQRAKLQTVSVEEAIELSSDEDIEHTVSTRLESQKLLDQMKQLKKEYREVLILRHVDQLSIKEIAVILEKKGTAVRVLLHRAIKKLQEIQEKSISPPNSD